MIFFARYVIFQRPFFGWVFFAFSFSLSIFFPVLTAQAQIWPDNENFERLTDETLIQANGIRYKTILQSQGKQLVFMQTWPNQENDSPWGYVGTPGNYFNDYPNKALVFNYHRATDGSANPGTGGYGIYRMLFSEAPFGESQNPADTTAKLGNFKLRSIYLAMGKEYGTEPTASGSSVDVNFHALRAGVSFARPFIYFGATNLGSGSIVSDGVTILSYSAMDKHGGRTVTFESDAWDFMDGLWISTAGNSTLPVLVDNIEFEAPVPVAPTQRSTQLAATSIGLDVATLRWQQFGGTAQSGNRRLVLIKETENETELPPSSVLTARPGEIPAATPRHHASPGSSGLQTTYGVAGTDLGDGWFCLYNDRYSNFPLQVSGLSTGKRYRVVVADYNGGPGFQTFMASPFQEGTQGNVIGFQTRVKPTVELSTDVPGPVNAPFMVSAVFSEVVTGMATSRFDVVNATLSDLTTDNNSNYTVLVTPAADGEVSIQLPLDAAFADGSIGSAASNLLQVAYDGTAPAIPQAVAADAGNGEVSLAWASNSEPDLAGYQVYGATNTEPTDLLATVAAGETSYVHTGLINGVLYHYRIAAVDMATNESDYSQEVSARPMGEQTVTFNLQDDATYGDGPITLNASASSGLPVEYSSSDAAIASVSGHVLTIHAAGSVVITATQPGDQETSPALGVQRQLTIHKAQPTITAKAIQHHVFDGSAKPVAVTVAPEELTDQLQYSPQSSFTNVGEHRIRIYLNESRNYLPAEAWVDFAIIPAGQQGITLPDLTMTYDGEEHGLEVMGAAPDAKIDYTLDGMPGNRAVNAGSYEVVAVVSRDNYADTTLMGTLYINKATAVIEAAAVQEHTYDGAAKAVVATLNHEETALSYTPQQAYTVTGNYRITVSTVGTANYHAASVTVTLRILPAGQEGLSLSSRTVTYSGQPHGLEVLGAAADVSVAYTIDGEPGNSAVDAGSYDVVAVVSREHFADTTLTATLTIDRALAYILGEENQVHRYDGMVKSLAVALNHAETELTYDRENAFVEAGTYIIDVAAARSNNYQAVSKRFTLRIEQAIPTGITMRDKAVAYDGTAKSLAIEGNLPEGTAVSYTINGAEGNRAVDAGTYRVEAVVSGPNHDTQLLDAELTIMPIARTLHLPALPEQVYGAANFSPGATTSSGEEVTYTSDNTAVAEITSDGLVRIVGAGGATIAATVPENTNYSNRPRASQPLMVAKAGQMITLDAPVAVDRDAGTVPITAISESGLPVVLAVDDEQVATLTSNTEGAALAIHRLGTVTITATQEGDDNHEAAEPVQVTVRVVNPVSDFPVRVHQAVSPNGDGINEFLMIEGIRDYRENRVKVFNRNGTVVWEASGYDNDRIAFRGIGTGQLRLPAGTYFYLVEVRNDDGQWQHHSGYFVLRY